MTVNNEFEEMFKVAVVVYLITSSLRLDSIPADIGIWQFASTSHKLEPLN
jgi:hypothetical protein